ncbi:MAG TPA: PilZ domain-containing protein [Bradyrhizobium sp.]|uniref:PilZ domain-containing protein n=1 Tax=Bradyrhizobium sp. TaxID=376 RepID=UPI002C45765B|nr:PilZ domain-containing protein [Bradyrhizobium sp.]HLZ03613.1 PilZ domain-containing protein [Bradyrhizobium sp.]
MSDGEKGEKRQSQRVRFEHKRPAQMMAIDGTWQRPCTIDDISDGGAKLTVGDSIQGLPITEFFLVLSPFGLAYRHCRLIWVNGDQIGVAFANRGRGPKKAAQTA